MLVERGPLLGLVAHLHDGHEDLGGGVHVAPGPGLLLQGQEHLDGAQEIAVPCHLFGLGNLSLGRRYFDVFITILSCGQADRKRIKSLIVIELW